MQTSTCGHPEGFTLLEVLIVLVIGSLLAGIMVTRFSEGPVLRTAAREVATSLRQARVQAVLNQQSVVWKMDIQSRRYWVEGTSADAAHTLHSDITAQVHTAASEVDSSSQGGIRFFPDGSATGGNVELVYQQQTYRINVAWVTGRVSVE